MSKSNPNQASAYRDQTLRSEIDGADAHRLIQMLLEGALEKIVRAKHYIVKKDLAEKGRHIAWAMDIVDGLKISLDAEQGDEKLVQNLEDLYNYVNHLLLQASATLEVRYLDQAAQILTEIKAGWDAINHQVTAPQVSECVMEEARTFAEKA
ncbi:MAG TPA: flagellar export chaperone FliS [Gammaproteobacteria bacterium]|nr:flagellar export chaperone FliS [Gammaproteobacteria bacterium]